MITDAPMPLTDEPATEPISARRPAAARALFTAAARPVDWPRALAAVGWIHLIAFGGCQVLQTTGDSTNWHYLAIWAAELAANLLALRYFAGPGWAYRTPRLRLLARMALTLLIMKFNLVSLNYLTGIESGWYRLAWVNLAAMTLANLAWQIDLRFLAGAVLMFFSGLVMAKWPEWQLVTYGLTWWVALQALAVIVAADSRPVDPR